MKAKGEKEMFLPSGAEFIIEKLMRCGYRADVVGGCVRDFLLSRPLGDYDITTSATPLQVMEVFGECRIIETGIKHGTLTIIADGVPYEVTSYRKDGKYKDNRHPENVTFSVTLEEDLSRRDFTVNAMCYNHKDGITDIYGGMTDIQKKLIRAVGEPTTRFSEDALRIMRAIRFASVLGFKIEEKTAEAVHSNKHLLESVSRERIYTEWKKLLSGESAYDVISEYSDVIEAAIPELHALHLPPRETFNIADFTSRLFSIYYLTNRCGFENSMRNLHTDAATITLGKDVLLNFKETPPKTENEALILLSSVGESTALECAKLGMALGKWEKSSLDLINEAISSGKPYKVSMLAIGGADIISLGLFGEAVGRVLKELLVATINAECGLSKNEQIDYVRTKLL